MKKVDVYFHYGPAAPGSVLEGVLANSVTFKFEDEEIGPLTKPELEALIERLKKSNQNIPQEYLDAVAKLK